MTITNTNVSLADVNSNLNRVSSSQATFTAHVAQLRSTFAGTPVSASETRGRVKDSGYVCLIKCDGANNSTSVSDITNTFALTSIGTATISTAQSKFGSASLYTNTTATSFALTNNPSNTNLTSYSGDWTIEMFVYYQNGGSSVMRFISGFAGSYDSSIRFYATGLHAYYFEPPSNTFRSITYNLASLPTNTWIHCAFVKSGTNLYLYYNGSQVGTTTCASVAMPMSGFYVGNSGSEFFTGYLDEIRFSNYARYTASTYTVPTASYDA